MDEDIVAIIGPIEVERIEEGQRFVTRLMIEGSGDRAALPDRVGGDGT